MSLDWTHLASTDLPTNGPVAFDADLSAENILAAAMAGFYCFPADSVEAALINEIRYAPDAETGAVHAALGTTAPFSVAWLCPDPRPVANLGTQRTGRTMRRFARRRAEWRTTINAAFDDVVNACAARRETTWITGGMRESLRALHRAGHAHSCEVWHEDRLIGGVFGLQLGAVFTADSQFTAEEGAGKIAVLDLMTRFLQGGGRLFDLQYDSVHVRNLGARPVPRATYLDALRQLRTIDVGIPHGRRSAEHIAELVPT